MKVEAILRTKGHRVVTVALETPLAMVIHKLRQEHIGAMPVSPDGNEEVGLISERDIDWGLAEHGVEVLNWHAARLMTHPVKTCTPGDTIKSVMAEMTRSRLRHLPVIDHGRLAGIVSIGDVVKNRLDELELEAAVMRDAYIGAAAKFS
jgi:CBS domain-containing protein